MELKVGMYVRFDWKKQQLPILIGKITEVHYDEDEKYYFYLTDNGLVIGEDNLVKEPSYKIISLIEDGDYINGEKVEDVILDNKMSRIKTTECSTYFEEDIKSIVTKQEFSQMEYKVGD